MESYPEFNMRIVYTNMKKHVKSSDSQTLPHDAASHIVQGTPICSRLPVFFMIHWQNSVVIVSRINLELNQNLGKLKKASYAG